MVTFYIAFSGPHGTSQPKKVQASSALDAIKNAATISTPILDTTLDGTRATVLGSNPLTEHWLFIKKNGVWKEHK
jgi:hypothetical protein